MKNKSWHHRYISSLYHNLKVLLSYNKNTNKVLFIYYL